MGGNNPYIKPSPTKRPQSKFSITFQFGGKTESRRVEVSPEGPPSSGTGLTGSLLDIALASDIDIDHACGGVCACATCHVIVKQGLSSCSENSEEEDDQLEKAPGLTSFSRLACQCVPDGTQDLVVEIPGWNRNLARE